jgi:hypothetical protein
MSEKKKQDRSRLWIDTITVNSQGLYSWEIFQGSISKRKGIAFSVDEAQEEIRQARESLGAT